MAQVIRRGPWQPSVDFADATHVNRVGNVASSPSSKVSLNRYTTAFLGVAFLSALVNILHLTGSLFMMEVYDRVLPSGSLPTLLALGGIVVGLYAFQAVFDIVRARILSRIGASLDQHLSPQVFQGVLTQRLRGPVEGDGQQPLRDLDRVNMFLSSGGPSALFDLPWMPLYLLVCFAFHWWIGIAALGGACLLIAMTLMTELCSRKAVKAALGAAQIRSRVTNASQRNAEVILALGMSDRLGMQWSQANEQYVRHQLRSSDVSGGFGATSRVIRMLMQSAVVAVGAYLVLDGQATGGVMIASSILAARALAPVELAIANWRGFINARQGWRRIKEQFAGLEDSSEPMGLAPPQNTLIVERIGGGAPGTRRYLADDISFRLKAGDGLGIIGPSASGKSSFARLLVGIWPTWRGKIRLDGAALDQWKATELGKHVGYLPQDVELFCGSIAQNISRFEPQPDPEVVIAAAKAAGVHDMILRLPEGYDTEIGEAGAALSGGQRQRLALARALYRDPFFVVLDEPNSNLDNEGELALTAAILGVRARKGIIIVIAHRPSALAGVDQILVMSEGKALSLGPKEEILTKVLRPVETGPRMPTTTPFEVASGRGAAS